MRKGKPMIRPAWWLALALAAAAPPALAQAWQGWFEQDGAKIPFASVVKLKKQPFKMIFNGPKDSGYALVGSIESRDVANRANMTDIGSLVRYSNTLMEKRGRENVELYLNSPQAFAALDNTAQVWTEEKEAERYNFQKFVIEPDGSATATHDIARICTRADYRSAPKCVAIKDYPGGAFYLVVSGVATRGMTFSGPRFIAVEFE